MSAHIGAGGAFKKIDDGAQGDGTAVGVGGSWKSVRGMWVGSGGAWKKFFDGLGQEFSLTIGRDDPYWGYDGGPNRAGTAIGNLSPTTFNGGTIETIVGTNTTDILTVYINGSHPQSFFEQMAFVFSSSWAKYQSAEADSFNVFEGKSIWQWENAGITWAGVGESFGVYFR